jgi:wyosine [tRNA(Phe)-imidazoG37] synthetase (radical SAM superfamily)
LEQLYQRLAEGVSPDYITLAGSGEPTLNSEIGSLISSIKDRTDTPVALLTNGSLLGNKEVRQSVMEADLVLPSLDAHSREGFETINRPHPEIRFETMVEGLIDFRKEYRGDIWLEIFILEGINASEDDAVQFRAWLERLNPQRIHVNTAVRPPAEPYARQVSQENLKRFCSLLGNGAEPAAPYEEVQSHHVSAHVEEELLNLLARRPCTIDDLSSGMGMHRNEAIKYTDLLLKDHRIHRIKKDGMVYYQRKLNP